MLTRNSGVEQIQAKYAIRQEQRRHQPLHVPGLEQIGRQQRQQDPALDIHGDSKEEDAENQGDVNVRRLPPHTRGVTAI